MTWSDIPWQPTRRTLRQFAALWLLFMGSLAFYHGFAHGRPGVGWAFLALAAGVGVPGLTWPRLLQPLFVAWCVAAFPIGWLVSRTVLATMFFGLVTPLALAFRLVGRDALRLRRVDGAVSYWEPKPAAAGPGSYLRQF